MVRIKHENVLDNDHEYILHTPQTPGMLHTPQVDDVQISDADDDPACGFAMDFPQVILRFLK